MATFAVTAPLVIVTDATGRQEYLYAGALVPEYVDRDRLEQLLAEGVVVDTAPVAKKPAKADPAA